MPEFEKDGKIFSTTKVLNFNLFKNKDKKKESHPDFGNSELSINVTIAPGVYRVAGWQYEDSGNISLSIERVEEAEAGPSKISGGFGV